MDDKQEGGSFVKQLQNKLKNLRKKLEKIEAKEKRPEAELSEDDKEQLRKKPATEMLAQEYERIYSNFMSSKEGTASVASIPVEVRTEIHSSDVTSSFLDLWLTLHHIALPGVKEAFLAAGGALSDFDVVKSLRKAALGAPGITVQEVLTLTRPVFQHYLKPVSESETTDNAAFQRVKDWCFSQRVPEVGKDLKVDRMMEEHQIIVAKEQEKKEEVRQDKNEEIKETPEVIAQPAPEEAPSSEPPSTSWVHHDSDEEPASTDLKPAEEDDGFVQVTGKAKRPKPAPEARGSGRPRRNGRRGRGGRGRGE